MPPRRTAKVAKGLKENVVADENKIKANNPVKSATVNRKPLGDKTNSASDDNASSEVTKASPKKTVAKLVSMPQIENHVRSRRERRVPSKFIEYYAEKNRPIIQESEPNTYKMNKQNHVSKTFQKPKEKSVTKSPVKPPQEDKECSIVVNRPKRMHRLPSRFEDHSISPSKFIPVQPSFASTPISSQKQLENLKTTENAPSSNQAVKNKTIDNYIKLQENTPNKKVAKTTLVKKLVKTTPVTKISKTTPLKTATDKSTTSKSPTALNAKAPSDTNNNPKPERRTRRKNTEKASQVRIISPLPPDSKNKRLINTSFSFRVLEDKKQSRKRPEEKLDVYEFTYDPTEEPPPQKKKRKRIIKKKKVPAKPKVVVVKNNYDTNINKTLASLKQAVTKTNNPSQLHSSSNNTKQQTHATLNQPSVATDTSITDKVAANSVQNIVASTEPAVAVNFNDHMDYSPAPSPSHSLRQQVKLSAINETRDLLYSRARSTMKPDNAHKDPLNLVGDLSFFDEQPVASSSMNQSMRHPLSSPWRAEFTNLPIKWPVNTYVKPNMTPAVESFISPHEPKKHVYTTMVPQANDTLPEIVTNDTNTSNLKQPSIMDFIREIALKNANKKKNKKTPIKDKQTGLHTPKKQPTQNKSNSYLHSDHAISPNVTVDPGPSNTSEQGNIVENRTPLKSKGDAIEEIPPAKVPCEPIVDNCFGFDDIENQENISPNKMDCTRKLRSRSRAVLKEINSITGPLKTKEPDIEKTKFVPCSEAVTKLIDEMKSATDAPELSKNTKQKEAETSNIIVSSHGCIEANDEESMHLFEDIDVDDHLKPQHQSYDKAKKVTICQKPTLSTETQQTKKQTTPNKSNNTSSYSDRAKSPSNTNKNSTMKQENSVESRTPLKRKTDAVEEIPQAKPSCSEEPNVDNCFGFNDSEHRENISLKKKDRTNTLRSKSKAVLKEINAITGPMRAVLLVAAESRFAPCSDASNKLFDDMVTAADAPESSKNTKEKKGETSDITDPSWHESMEANDEESVHLFEDIDFAHHLKKQRRSYGKAKKVTFCQKSTLNTETLDSDGDHSDKEDLDLDFKIPTITKRKRRAPKFSKKEKEEADAWAAAFNSMCEDVEDFPLVVE